MIAGLHGRYRCPKGAATVPGGFVILLPLYNAIYSCSQFFKTDPYKAAPFLKPRPRINSILTPDMSSWASASSRKLKTKIGEGGAGYRYSCHLSARTSPFHFGSLEARPGRLLTWVLTPVTCRAPPPSPPWMGHQHTPAAAVTVRLNGPSLV